MQLAPEDCEMTRNHRQNDHAAYDNKPTRRVDDYRPATLKRFWQSFQNATYGFRGLLDWVILIVVAAVAIGAIVASIEVLGPFIRNLIR